MHSCAYASHESAANAACPVWTNWLIKKQWFSNESERSYLAKSILTWRKSANM
nr:MAG TPA: hypothetical protein [Bacteriophage sp.]